VKNAPTRAHREGARGPRFGEILKTSQGRQGRDTRVQHPRLAEVRSDIDQAGGEHFAVLQENQKPRLSDDPSRPGDAAIAGAFRARLVPSLEGHRVYITKLIGKRQAGEARDRRGPQFVHGRHSLRRASFAAPVFALIVDRASS